MKKKYYVGLTNIIVLKYFTLFPEYFLSVSILYVLIAVLLLGYSVYGLIILKALNDCVALIVFMTFCLMINDDLMQNNVIFFYKSIANDCLSYISKIFICLFSVAYLLFISHSIKEQKLAFFEYFIIILFSILGLLLMCSSNDLLIAYLSIELSSLALYTLAAFKKTSIHSVNSGLTYFITGAISSSFFLLGSSFLYASCGTIFFSDLRALNPSHLVNLNPIYIPIGVNDNSWAYKIRVLKWICRVGFGKGRLFFEPDDLWYTWAPFDYSFVEIGQTFILFSLFIKLAAAPFHIWSLDVYEGSPTSSSFFFATVTKLSIFVLLIRISYLSFVYSTKGWQYYFVLVGVVSVFIGSFGGLRQRKIKTLLAYSSTTNMGYALMALGVNRAIGLQMLYFHIVLYVVSGLCVWAIVIFLRLKIKNKKTPQKYNKVLGDLSLLCKSNPALAFGLTLGVFSLSGVPPMAGFLAKMGIFMCLIEATYFIVAIPVIIFSIAATFYYVRLVKVIYFENILVGKLYCPINFFSTIILSFLTFLLLIFFLCPTLIYVWSYKIASRNYIKLI